MQSGLWCGKHFKNGGLNYMKCRFEKSMVTSLEALKGVAGLQQAMLCL